MAENKTAVPIPKICVKYEQGMYSRGLWFGENPLHNIFPLYMFQLILLFTISRTLYFVLRPLKQPKVVCNILGGFLFGPSVLGRYCGRLRKLLFPAEDLLLVGTLSSLSMVFFVFLSIVKMDKQMILKAAKEGWILGLLSILVPFAITFSLFNLLKSSLPGLEGGIFSLTLCSAFSSSFLSDISTAMDELKLLSSELGQLAITSAVNNDVIVWTNVTIMHITDSINSFLILGATVMIVLCAIRPTILWISRTSQERNAVHENLVIPILVQTMIMGVITDALGVGFFPGVMLMGLAIPNGPPLGAAIIEKSEFIVNELFLPFFFLQLGLLIDTNATLDWKEFTALLFILISGYLAKILAVCLYSLFYEMRFRNVLLLSLILNTKGAVKFVFYIRFFKKQRLDIQSFVLVVLTDVAMTAIATPLIEHLYKPHLRLGMSLSGKLNTLSLQLTPIIGELRILSCIHSEDDVHGIITLLEASNPTPVTTICAYVIHLIELVGGAIPVISSYEESKMMGNMSTDRIMRAFTNYSNALSGQSVVVQPLTSIAPYETVYESICRVAQLKRVPLIIVPFHKSQIGLIDVKIRTFNVQMQAYAPCTVGILVQKGLSSVSCVEFSCKLAVLFIGGADDREALALASRMSGHPSVEITVMRFILRENHHENEAEHHQDENLLKQFKAETQTKVSVQCLDVLVNDGIEIFGRIRSLEDRYDLIMVGKKQGTNLRLERDMECLVEYPELGIIGDMLASEDLFGVTVSLLVLQHCEVDVASKK